MELHDSRSRHRTWRPGPGSEVGPVNMPLPIRMIHIWGVFFYYYSLSTRKKKREKRQISGLAASVFIHS
jgi:hypothetical protein